MLARRSEVRHGQRKDEDQLDEVALWSSTHDAPTFIMNLFATSTGNNRVFVCGQSRTGTPFSAQTRGGIAALGGPSSLRSIQSGIPEPVYV
jgi:hypothetical protein